MTFFEHVSDIIQKGICFVQRDGNLWHEEKNCRVSIRYASDHSKKTSGLGLRLIIRKNIERLNVYTFIK